MITRQHTAIFAMQIFTKLGGNLQAFEREFEKRLPFVLLPDAIRAYVGPRQAGHFERTPDGNNFSWMKFPTSNVLEHLSKETVTELVKYQVAEGYPKCVIGEESSISEFDKMNYAHPNYHDLRIHLLQDMCLDRMLRKQFVDCTHRFENRFAIHHNRGVMLNGQELREQLALFEELGFIYLVGKVFEQTGMLLDGGWFDRYVERALLLAYPKDLAEKTYSYIRFSDQLNQRIKNYCFELTEEEKKSVIIADDIISNLDELYAEACWYTFQEL